MFESTALRAAVALTALLATVCAALAQTPPPRFENTMAQRLAACVVCHGKEGRATRDGYFPRIAGKPAGYLEHQLLNFRDGRRGNPTMRHLVDTMSDAYLREIAEHFAALELPYPPSQAPPVPPAMIVPGEMLVRRGDAGRRLPACAACHGAALTGVQPAFPGLLGLPRDYLLAQLGAWRTGQRHALAPDCMATIAARLAPEDVVAVASWLAAQDLPTDTRPAPEPTTPRLPIACGSGPR